MKEALTYFKAERAESLGFVVVGMVGLILSLWFWFSVKKPFYNGMASSLAAIALIQSIVGGRIYFRTPADIKRIETYWTSDRPKIKSEELPRMEKVMHSFVTYRYAEIILAIVGLALIFFFKEPVNWKGLGAGLFAQAMLMLLFDHFAESRGKVYITFLRNLTE